MTAATPSVEYEGRDLEALSDMPNYYAWIMRWFAPFVHGETVEYGAGAGTVSTLLRDRAERLTLVEPSANLHALLQDRFESDDRVSISNLNLETHVAALSGAAIDTIVLVNVLEHIEDDDSALREFARVLKPGGYLLIFVPALSLLMSDFDRALGHFRRYHQRALRRQLSAAGLSVRDSRYFDLLGAAPWFLFNTLLRGRRFNSGMLKVYDKVLVPLSRTIESLTPPPFGKNIVVIAQRPL